MRADEHEGELNNTEIKRAKDRMNKREREILEEDVNALVENKAFLRWFSRYAYPALMQAVPVNNGSMLAEFMGRRQLIIQIVDEMNTMSPGFLQRILSARSDREHELQLAASSEDSGDSAPRE